MVCFPGLGPSDIHDIPIWSMLWCDRLYSQKGKKLIVRTCYYLSFILKYKNSNSQCNNVTSGGRFCKLIFNSYQKFLCSKPDALLFCVLDLCLCRRQTAYHIPEMTDIAHVWHCEASINVKKNQSVTAWFMWISVEKAQDPLFLVTCTLSPST